MCLPVGAFTCFARAFAATVRAAVIAGLCRVTTAVILIKRIAGADVIQSVPVSRVIIQVIRNRPALVIILPVVCINAIRAGCTFDAVAVAASVRTVSCRIIIIGTCSRAARARR